MNSNYIIHESAQFGEINITKRDKNCLEFICVLQEADAPNRNGRVYPKTVLEKALKAPNIQERLLTKTWYGEAGHPLDTSVQRQMTIDLRNVAFIIKEIWWEGNILKGRCECANTSCGKDMQGLIEQGCKVAFSLRAQGNVHTNPVTGLVEVEEGLQILGYDWVQTPSHAKAFMEKICEATIMSMYKTNKQNLNASVLCESEDIFMQGRLLNVGTETAEVKDYTGYYTPKFKNPADMYIPENNDIVETMDLKETIIVNENTNITKKVLTEDYIVKDIRSKLCQICEAPWALDGTYRDEKLVKDKKVITSGPNRGWFTGTAEFRGKRENVYGHSNPNIDKLHGLDLTDEEADRNYKALKNSQLDEAPTGEVSGRWYSDKNVVIKHQLPDGRFTGVGVKNGEHAERVIGHTNKEIDVAQHKVIGAEKDHDEDERDSRREIRGNIGYNIDATHEILYGKGGK